MIGRNPTAAAAQKGGKMTTSCYIARQDMDC